MKPFAVIPLLLLLAVSGCQSFSPGAKTAHAGESGLQVFFYYDQTAENNAQDEYFNALLEVVNHYALDRKRITIRSGETSDLREEYGLGQCPALIVKNNGITKIHMEGAREKQAIINQLAHIIKTR
ncbi:MAG TPA: hypothetical protein VF149_07290 [Bacillales bacterium]